jgi:hypothetical protein
VSWLWLLPAFAPLAAVVALACSLRHVRDEATALQASLSAWERLAVAMGDLDHEARRAELDLRRLTRR